MDTTNEQTYTALWHKPHFHCIAAIDPAISEKERSCYTAIVTVGWDTSFAHPPIYVLDARQGHWKPTAVLEQAYSVSMTYHPDKVLIEDVAFQTVFVDLWREMASNRDCDMPLLGEKPIKGTDKLTRLSMTAKYFRDPYRVLFDDRSVTSQKLIEQIVTYSKGNTCDLMDAFAMAVNHLTTRYKPGAAWRQHGRSEPVYRRGRIVGYRETT